MPLLVFLGFPILEIYVMYKVGSRIGGWETIWLLMVSGFAGLLILQTKGRAIAVQMQAQMARGEVPVGKLFHSVLIVLGGLLLMIPGFISDVFGWLLIIPGPRHMLGFFLRRFLEKQIRKGTLRFQQTGGFSFGFGGLGRQGPFKPSPADNHEETFERDVGPKVIDVTPISSTTRRKDGPTED